MVAIVSFLGFIGFCFICTVIARAPEHKVVCAEPRSWKRIEAYELRGELYRRA